MPTPTSAMRQSVDARAARNLASTTKTVPQTAGTTPRWLLRLLPWVQVQGGTYRVNRRRVVLKPVIRLRPNLDGGGPLVGPEELRALPMLQGLNGSAIQAIAQRLVPEEHAGGEVLFEEGDAGEKFYIVARGKVEVTTAGVHGERLRLGVLGHGDYFGEIALMRDTPRTATVRTLTPCVLLALSGRDFAEFVAGAPGVQEHLERAMAERLRARAAAEETGEQRIHVEAGHEGEADLPETFADYEDAPREYPLSVVQTIVRVHTRISDIYNEPIHQLREQIRLAIEGMKERQEWECLNNADFGLLNQADPSMRVHPRRGAPTPDDMDELLARVWKKPSFFLAHPRAIAAFGRECTRRGVPPPTVQMFGSPLLTWRGVPIVPSNKLEVRGQGGGAGTTNILLLRVGETDQGVVGLHQTGIPDEQMPSLSVRFMGINKQAVASYLLTLYFSTAVLTEDALGVLEDVEVGYYHEYA